MSLFNSAKAFMLAESQKEIGIGGSQSGAGMVAWLTDEIEL
jgi:hypothetical protein